MSRTAHARRPRGERLEFRKAFIAVADSPYAVMATIHGPSGWFDVTPTSTGKTVAVVPRRSDAHQIARLLSEHTGQPSPSTVLAAAVLSAVIEWADAEAAIDAVRTGDGWNRLHAAEARLREIAGRAR